MKSKPTKKPAARVSKQVTIARIAVDTRLKKSTVAIARILNPLNSQILDSRQSVWKQIAAEFATGKGGKVDYYDSHVMQTLLVLSMLPLSAACGVCSAINAAILNGPLSDLDEQSERVLREYVLMPTLQSNHHDLDYKDRHQAARRLWAAIIGWSPEKIRKVAKGVEDYRKTQDAIDALRRDVENRSDHDDDERDDGYDGWLDPPKPPHRG